MKPEIQAIAAEVKAKMDKDNQALLDKIAQNWISNPYIFFGFCKTLEAQTRRKEGQTRIKYRLQACLSFPYLSKIMGAPLSDANDTHHYPSKHYKELFDNIDAGKPLIPALIRYFKFKKNHFIEEKHIKAAIKNCLYVSDDLLDHIAENLSIDHFPKNAQELSNLRQVINSTSLKRVNVADLRHVRADQNNLRSTCLRAFNAKTHEMFDQKNQEQPIATLRDTASWLHENIASSLMHNDPKAKFTNLKHIEKFQILALKEVYNIFAEQKLSGMMDLNFQMHKNRAHIVRALEEYDSLHVRTLVQEWVTRYPGADSSTLAVLGDLKIVPLLTRNDLIEEYKRLDHCVDTYAPKCILGQSHVYSLRDEEGNSLSTFEINEDNQLIQHFGYGNTTPSENQQNAVNAYIKAIQTKEILENKNYEDWVAKRAQFTSEEIYGYEGIIPYERAQIFFKAAAENYALTKRTINSLIQRNIMTPSI